MSKDWDGIEDVFSAAIAADQAGFEVDQRVEELALVLERSLPGTCLVTRTGRGAGPVRRLQVLTGRDCLLCERRDDGSWATSIAVLQGNVVGRPRPVPPAHWVRTLRQRLRERVREQGELAEHLRGLLGE
ncbi:MAG: hypothetical protein J2P38_09870 [Candidatus Dormibacteraeota bacterium]|nr:hypothetical protein [Candidatus Dormibacteraeota bacterium]